MTDKEKLCRGFGEALLRMEEGQDLTITRRGDVWNFVTSIEKDGERQYYFSPVHAEELGHSAFEVGVFIVNYIFCGLEEYLKKKFGGEK